MPEWGDEITRFSRRCWNHIVDITNSGRMTNVKLFEKEGTRSHDTSLQEIRLSHVTLHCNDVLHFRSKYTRAFRLQLYFQYVGYTYRTQGIIPLYRLSDTGSDIHCHQSEHTAKTQHPHENAELLITAALVGGR